MDKKAARQYPLTLIQVIDFSDLESGTALDVAELPSNAIVTGGMVVIDTAWNSGTSDTLIIGDAEDDNRYGNAINMQTAGATALTLTGYKHAAQEDVKLIWTGVGAAPTAGSARLILEYVVDGRSHSTQG